MYFGIDVIFFVLKNTCCFNCIIVFPRYSQKIIVRGGRKLNGTVKVEGAKNAVLPVIAASLLASEEKSVICDVPTLSDVYTFFFTG